VSQTSCDKFVREKELRGEFGEDDIPLERARSVHVAVAALSDYTGSSSVQLNVLSLHMASEYA
jgi:hypothetical protein